MRYLHEVNPNHCCKNTHCKTKTYRTAVLNIKVSVSEMADEEHESVSHCRCLQKTQPVTKTSVQFVFVTSETWDGGLFHIKTLSLFLLHYHFLLCVLCDHFKIMNSMNYIKLFIAFDFTIGWVTYHSCWAATMQLLIIFITDSSFFKLNHLVCKISNNSGKIYHIFTEPKMTSCFVLFVSSTFGQQIAQIPKMLNLNI